jgi:UDP-glucose 4-epimerase
MESRTSAEMIEADHEPVVIDNLCNSHSGSLNLANLRLPERKSDGNLIP